MTFSAKNLFSEKFRAQDLESQELFAGLNPFEPQKYWIINSGSSSSENQTGWV